MTPTQQAILRNRLFDLATSNDATPVRPSEGAKQIEVGEALRTIGTDASNDLLELLMPEPTPQRSTPFAELLLAEMQGTGVVAVLGMMAEAASNLAKIDEGLDQFWRDAGAAIRKTADDGEHWG